MITKKHRRHQGRKTICVNDKEYPYQETFWDDWKDHRDGLRTKEKDKPKSKYKKKVKDKWDATTTISNIISNIFPNFINVETN